MSLAALALSLFPSKRESPLQRKRRETRALLNDGVRRMKKPKPVTILESVIHNTVVQYLKLMLPRDAVFHHSPNEGKRGWKAQRSIKSGGTVAGWPDIEIIWDGKAYFLELKSAIGRLRPEQTACHMRLVEAGAGVATCRTVDAVAEALKLWRIPTSDASVRKAAA